VDFDPVRAKMEGRQPAGMDAETAALFPDAFEDSELGRIPKGWGVQRLEQHLDAEKGLSYSGSGLSETSGVPMHNLNSVYEGGGYKFEGIKFYTGEFRERHVLHPGDVIVANTEQGFDYLLIGYPAIVPKHFGNTGIFSHHIFRVRPVPGSPLTTRFIHYLLMVPLVREQVVACTNGTTVNMLSVDGLRTPRFVLSSVELIQRFESIAAPVFAKAEGNYEQSLSLAALRDALLPKLISGEVRVKDAGKFVVEML
jgi:type I restriction enzyme S subunit